MALETSNSGFSTLLHMDMCGYFTPINGVMGPYIQYLVFGSHFDTALFIRHPEKKHISLPIGSMYGIFTYIWLICMVNVGKYTIHGSYGLDQGTVAFHELIAENGHQLHTTRVLAANGAEPPVKCHGSPKQTGLLKGIIKSSFPNKALLLGGSSQLVDG